jgi:light-regulated signal transduction histidine kinase (bacteriophytochrome)
LITSIISVAILLLGLLVLWQRKTIKVQDAEIEKQLIDINKKNTYLEHAARIIRHDMHSGINTYIPRGLSSLEKRLTPEEIINLKIDGSVKMIKEGLNHTQKVYKSVYEFTNLVKQNIVLEKNECDLEELIKKSIVTTSYANQVTIDKLTTAKVNETLFWNAIDSLIKNGLKYNKNELKWVKIYMEEGNLVVEDNGTGLSEKKFKKILSSKVDNSDEESGLGLNICNAILVEHGFELSCQEIETGTKLKIKL